MFRKKSFRIIFSFLFSFVMLNVLFSGKIQALTPSYQWSTLSQGLDTWTEVEMKHVDTDSAGNVYFGGRYMGPIYPEASTNSVTHTSVGETWDNILVSLTPDGAYRWSLAFGTTSNMEGISAIEITSNDKIIVTYRTDFAGSYDLDPTSGVDSYNLTEQSVVVSSLNSDGSYNWSDVYQTAYDADIAPNNVVQTYSISSNASNEIFLIGNFFGRLDLDSGAGTNYVIANIVEIEPFVTQPVPTPFVVKLSDTGLFLDFEVFETEHFNTTMYDSAMDSSGNLFLTGTFTNTFDIDPSNSTQFPITVVGSADFFIVKLNSNLEFISGFGLGTVGADTSPVIAIDSSENLFVTGSFGGTLDLNPTGTVDSFTATGTRDIYISKFSNTLSYISSKIIYSVGGWNYPMAIDTDSLGSIYITGGFSGNTDFDTDLGEEILVPDLEDAFIAKYDSNISLEWVQQVTSTDYIWGEGIAVSDLNDVFTVGYFNTDFTVEGETSNPATTEYYEYFIVKYAQIPDPVSLINIGSSIVGKLFGTSTDVAVPSTDIVGEAMNVQLEISNIPFALIIVNLTEDRNWGMDVLGGSSIEEGKSFMHATGGLAALPGAASSYSLLVPQLPDSTGVLVCPNATSLLEVTQDCVGGYELLAGDVNLSTSTIDGQVYWVVSNLTGTGAQNVFAPTSATLLVTPNEIDLGGSRNVNLIFASTNGEFSSGDTITFNISPSLGTEPVSSDVDADNDGTPDGSFTLVTNTQFVYTFTASTTVATTTSINLALTLADSTLVNSYGISLTDSNGNFGSTTFSVAAASAEIPTVLPTTGLSSGFVSNIGSSEGILIFGLMLSIIGIYVYRFRIFKAYKLSFIGKSMQHSGVASVINLSLRKK